MWVQTRVPMRTPLAGDSAAGLSSSIAEPPVSANQSRFLARNSIHPSNATTPNSRIPAHGSAYQPLDQGNYVRRKSPPARGGTTGGPLHNRLAYLFDYLNRKQLPLRFGDRDQKPHLSHKPNRIQSRLDLDPPVLPPYVECHARQYPRLAANLFRNH